MSSPLVVVLGASGFVGTALTRQFAGRDVRLRLVSRRRIVAPTGCRAEVETLASDLTQPGAVAEAVAGADVVIHLAAHIAGSSTWRVAEGDTSAKRVNLGVMHEVIAALRGREEPPVVVFAGSISQLGEPRGPLITGREPDEPVTEYDRHKLAAERALNEATAGGLVRGITLRLPTLYGQGIGPSSLERGVLAAMMRRAFSGQPLTMWHDGSVARDLLCVDDAARAFVAAIDNADALAGRPWLIGTCVATPMGSAFHAVASLVSEVTGEPVVPVVQVEPEHAVTTDLLDFVVGTTEFGSVTGWAPRVELTSALRGAAETMHAERAPAPVSVS
ncbi:NAD(P)-dependent oxidoreductase [Allokutzneria sp. NRRL B-24872]|uniref:NAD-dependent epimerase/dehydratase family protein n=1 Tax=Allokutzneria sp. NRRL B-24872 TaxID=1137961 RepID=UPI000A3CE3B0|nr:NAD-dependent epimerase/dehydratase family protein [Allokutzneria sp. NRRL B-24872]